MNDKERPMTRRTAFALGGLFTVGATAASAPAVIGLAKYAGELGGRSDETFRGEQFWKGLLVTTPTLFALAVGMTALENRLRRPSKK